MIYSRLSNNRSNEGTYSLKHSIPALEQFKAQLLADRVQDAPEGLVEPERNDLLRLSLRYSF